MFFSFQVVTLHKTDGDGKVYFQNLDVSMSVSTTYSFPSLFTNISSFRCITKMNLLIHVNMHIK